MKKTDKEILEIILKNVINMHEKINLIQDSLNPEINEEVNQFYSDEDKLVDIDKNTYETMCEMMGTGHIPFMGIA